MVTKHQELEDCQCKDAIIQIQTNLIQNQSLWDRKVQWAAALQGLPLNAIIESVKIPLPDEEVNLAGLMEATTAFMTECESYVKFVPETVLYVLRLFDRHGKAKQPFSVVTSEQSRQTYFSTWGRLLAYVIRIHSIRPVLIQNNNNDNNNNATFTTTTTNLQAHVSGVTTGLRQLKLASNDYSAATIQHLFGVSIIGITDCLLSQLCTVNQQDSILVQFATRLGVNAYYRTFQESYGYTSKLSQLIYCCCIISIANWAVTNCLSSHRKLTESIVSKLQSMHSTYLCRESNNGFSVLIDWLRYGRSITNNTNRPPVITWKDASLQEFSLGPNCYSINKIRYFISNVTKHVNNVTTELLLFGPLASTAGVVDLHNNTNNYHSLADADTGDIRSKFTILRRILNSNILRKKSMNEMGLWKENWALLYHNHADLLLRQIFLLVHLCGGQPARS